jgi:hypothetical protein
MREGPYRHWAVIENETISIGAEQEYKQEAARDRETESQTGYTKDTLLLLVVVVALFIP